ncbi:hypothetical protein G6F31_021185 [Rhizopus arrhizus]|nr:hypothetical protein G6F31_021185 [Rhizopus arrhizus]
MFRISSSSRQGSVCVGGEAQAVAVGVTQQHLAAAPFGVMRRLLDRHVRGAEGTVQRIDILDDEVHRAADLAITGVFGEEEGLASTTKPRPCT